MNHDETEIVVQGRMAKWFRERGYDVPTQTTQLLATKNGKKVKNGQDVRIRNGTRIVVKIKDLPPASNTNITRLCTSCKKEFTTRYGAYLKKKESDRCDECSKKKIKGDGSHGYWVKKLIADNKTAACDISGEEDKRFLILHHLDSRSNGGRNNEENYVVLSANYHLAFHVWNGGTGIPCTMEQYVKFKDNEKRKIQADMLADDWMIVE